MAETIDESYKQPSKKGTGFTNIQRVLDANVGNRLGSTVGQGVQRQGQDARQNIQQASQQFQHQSEANRIGTQQDQQMVGNILQDPTQVANPQQSRFQQLMMGTYKGPQELENRQKLASQAQQAQFLGQAAGTPGGRIELLRRFAAPDQSQYGLGKQSYDNLLLGQQEDELRGARRATQNLGDLYATREMAARGLHGQFTADAQRIGAETQQQFGQTVEGFYDQLEQDRQRAMEERQQKIKDLQSYYGKQGGMTQEDIDRFGLQQYLGQHTYGLNLGNYLRSTEEEATLQNVASAEQMARLNALRNLAGTTVEGDVQSQLQLFEGMTPEEAQAFQRSSGYDLDSDRLNRDFQSAKAHAERAYYDMGIVSDEFWAASDELRRLVPDQGLRDQLVQNALRGHFDPNMVGGSPFTLDILNHLGRVAKNMPLLQQEHARRRGSQVFQTLDPMVQTQPVGVGQ